jgi:LmbE family N-acetylglucosaminyl deacetylase
MRAPVSDFLGDATVLVVSPHLDDGIVSAFGLVVRRRSVLVTVFTAPAPDHRPSTWDQMRGFDSSEDAMKVRRDEDCAAAALVGREIRHLGFAEHSYRSEADTKLIRDKLQESLLDTIASIPGNVKLALPAGLGQVPSALRLARRRLSRAIPIPGIRMLQGDAPHPDHRLVRDTAIDVAVTLRRPFVVYEDLPYANAGGRKNLRERLPPSPWTVQRTALPIDLLAKERAMLAYGSQSETFLPPWTDKIPDVFKAVERYWLVAPP